MFEKSKSGYIPKTSLQGFRAITRRLSLLGNKTLNMVAGLERRRSQLVARRGSKAAKAKQNFLNTHLEATDPDAKGPTFEVPATMADAKVKVSPDWEFFQQSQGTNYAPPGMGGRMGGSTIRLVRDSTPDLTRDGMREKAGDSDDGDDDGDKKQEQAEKK